MKYSIIQLLIVCCLFTISYANTNEKELNTDQVNTTALPIIRLGFDAPKIDHRQLLLAAHEATTDGLDWGYDAEMYEVLLDDMFWLIESKKCVIQGVQTFYIDKEIPLGIVMSETGDVQIKVDALENPIDSLVVYLKDTELNKLYNIQDSVYQSTLEAGEYSDRFVLTLKSIDFVNEPEVVEEEPVIEEPIEEEPVIEEPIEIIKQSKVKIFYNHKISSLVIRNKNNVEISGVLLFDRFGNQVKEWSNIKNLNKVKLPVRVKRGMYFSIINTEIKTIKRKIFIH